MRPFRYLIGMLCLPLLLTACNGSFLPLGTTGSSDDRTSLTYPNISTENPSIFYKFPSVLDIGSDDIGIEPIYSSRQCRLEEDGPVLLNVSMVLPRISYADNDRLQPIVDESLADIRSIFEGRIEHLVNAYQTDLATGTEFFCTPAYAVSYSITDFSENRISLLFTERETNADGQSSTVSHCRVIDLKAGFIIDLSTLFTGGISERLLSMIHSGLARSGHSLYAGYESAATASIKNGWLVVPEGLCLVFSPGVVAPADQGVITLLLSASSIDELLSEYGATILTVSGTVFNPETDPEPEPEPEPEPD